MVEGSIGLGDFLKGENSVSYEFGCVTAMQQSTGSRKGMIYKIGVNWFFADEISHDWWRELQHKVGVSKRYDYKSPIKVIYNKKPYKAIRVMFDDNYYVVLEDKTGALVYEHIIFLPTKTLERLVNQYDKEQIS
jgi:hypothetical protein